MIIIIIPEHNMIKLYETSLTPYAEIPIIMMIMLIINYAPSILFNNNIRKTIFKSSVIIASIGTIAFTIISNQRISLRTDSSS